MVLAKLTNWVESRTAVLEYDNDTIYLYNYSHDEGLEPKSLWIANTKKRIFNNSSIKADMDKGLQPYMPKEFCEDEAYIKVFKNKESWCLQWGLEQNSVAVFYKDNIIAIMPEFSGVSGFWGYSTGATKETPIAWPLLKDNIQINRFLEEKAFLESWTESIWVSHQENLLSIYRNAYPDNERYFVADGGLWPNLGIHYSRIKDLEFLATVGMSQLPMPEFGMVHEDPEEYRQIEIALVFRPLEKIELLAQYLSGQARFPWHFETHLDHGHTLPCEELLELGSKASFVILVETASFLSKLSMPSFNKRGVRLLFMIPIYESEQQFSEKHSTQELINKLESKCEDPFDIYRKPIV